jgi:hypothetical protein
VGIAAATFRPSVLDPESGIIGHGNLVLLEPEKWVGKPFPLAEHIDVGKELTRGRWTVVLYRHDCADCPAAIAEHERRARAQAGDPDAPRVALIEVAPPRRGGRHLVGAGSPCLLGRLSADREWFVTTPAILSLHDGRVVEARGGAGK